jgi:hypothetical protein
MLLDTAETPSPELFSAPDKARKEPNPIGVALAGNLGDPSQNDPDRPADELTFDPNPDRRSCPPKTALARVLGPDCPPRQRKARDRSLGEGGDNYPGTLFSIPGTTYRVAVCAKGYCWICSNAKPAIIG